jgi:hypothetical protein
MYQSYVYKLTNKVTGQFYFGSRTGNVRKCRNPEDDLWIYYFSSSRKVKELIEEHGINMFVVEILSRHDDYESCFWAEQHLILLHKFNSLRLNKAYVDPVTGKKVLTTHGESVEQKETRISKMSKTKKGKFNSNGHFGMKHTAETKEKIAKQAGWKHSDEAKEKMKAYVRTPDHAAKLGNSLKGKPWSEARRAVQLNKKENNHGRTPI